MKLQKVKFVRIFSSVRQLDNLLKTLFSSRAGKTRRNPDGIFKIHRRMNCRDPRSETADLTRCPQSLLMNGDGEPNQTAFFFGYGLAVRDGIQRKQE